MKTVSDYRNEKNIQDAKDEYLSNLEKKLSKLKEWKIELKQQQIDKEIKSIPDCLKQGFYEMAQTKINRIVDLREQIIDLRMNK